MPVVADGITQQISGANLSSYFNTNVGNITSTTDVNITIDTPDSSTFNWQFGADGSLTLPIGVSIDNNVGPLYPKIIADSGKLFSVQGQGNTGSAALAWTVNPNAASQYAAVAVTRAGGDNLAKVVLQAQSDSGNAATVKLWKFDETGKITFPNGASLNDTSGDSVAFGQNAGLTSQAQHAVAIGINAGREYQGEDSIAIGYNAGYRDQGRGVAIGWNAGQGGTLFKSVSDAQGGSGPVHNYVSGNGNPTLTLDSVVSVNVNDKVFGNNIPAGAFVASINAPDINISAPPTAALTAGDDITFVSLTLGLDNASNIVVGMRATGTDIPANTFVQNTGCSIVELNQYPTAPLTDGASIVFSVGQGFGATAVGYQSGSTFQGDDAVAVGRQAGYSSQNDKTVAVGGYAGYNVQGANAVAVGYNAGQGTQGANTVAIGSQAGAESQGIDAVAIGAYAGNVSQGNAAVAIGRNAGNTSQGLSSIAIGENAGYTNQANNSIILNATGANLNQTTANTFTVAPVRNDVANIGNVMFYNTTSKEITYGNVISVAGNITGGNINTGSRVVTTPVAFSTLTAVTGARAFVNDGNLVAATNFGAQVSGGGANTVPVWSDGTNWYIG